MTRFDKTMITDEMVEKFAADMTKKADDRKAFFESDLCKRMIADVIATEPLTCSEVSYFFEATAARNGWGDISKEQVQMFISVMSDASDADAFIDCPDDDNPFDHSLHLKGGLMVFMMHGQGTVVTILGPEHVPEMFERLNDLVKRPITMEYRYVESDPWKPVNGHGCSSIAEAKKYCKQMGGKVFRWSAA